MDKEIVYGHLLAAAVAFSGSVSSRLMNSGAMTTASRKSGLLGWAVLLFVVIDFVAVGLAVFYFSWSYLGWLPLITFFAVYLTIADRIAKTDSEALNWVVLVSSCLMLVVFEYLLWIQ